MEQNITSRTDGRQELREHVVDVAMEAFCAEGIRHVKMDDIARRLGMSKRTLYELFADKESLLLSGIESRQQQHTRLLEEEMQRTDNVLDLILFDFGKRLVFLKQINPSFFVDVPRFPRVLAAIKAYRQQHLKNAVDFLRRGVEQGLFRPDVNFEIIGPFLMNHIDSVQQREIMQAYTPTEVFRHLVFFHLRGCTTPEGMRMMDEFLERYE